MRCAKSSNFAYSRFIFLATFILLYSCKSELFSQELVSIKDHVPQHIFSYNEIEMYEDPEGTLQMSEVLKPAIDTLFKKSRSYTPKIFNFKSYYWFKIRVRSLPSSKKNWMLEFFDQTIDEITLYAPDQYKRYTAYHFGDRYPFRHRTFQHKNFTFNLDPSVTGDNVYYVRLKSSQSASVIIVLRNVERFVEYAIEEYMIFGIFYGMIIVFSLYNILMFFAVRQKQYLYYVLYNLSIGLYEMCIDGIAFQYLWPNYPDWNQYSYGIALFSSSVFALLFASSFLYLKAKFPRLYHLINVVILLRIAFLLACLIDKNLFTYKIVEVVPTLAALYAGIYVWKSGYRPARFFVIGYLFLLLGIVVKILILFNVNWLPYGPVTHYSLSFCFVMEMVLVSFAIGDNVAHLKRKKVKAQRRMIHQLQVNEKLKDTLNKELSTLVDKRTRQLVEKASIIEQQNAELSDANALLEKQSAEISRINGLLQQDNQNLHVNIEKVTRARVMSQDVDFSEFSEIYPDRETCFKFLSDLKWAEGYSCKKCGNTNYLHGQLPYSRRCTKCRYEESVIANTIFQNSRIPINKAFYMLFLVYSTKGKISSHKLSEILEIRQSTCWSYSSRMKKVMEDRKKDIKNAGDRGWSKLVLDYPIIFSEK
ncbi:7TMR-DISM extracellular protein 2 [Arcticibacter pallidicorallinus]|uniref:7TMR-DISM extracellular protein 2 n=1 Tax=Arcticibacter pallidicorallinus TaxID=1259464 RepID=A0A2T0UC67_9SPHI|nr:7TM diverse intracellular signaling domain-containing protein [Arcticibacter pallidicorallinus]PRY55407.1 7TMR-DISM extracellular protein 2 [Arcticibacter pallidicorallinus]